SLALHFRFRQRHYAIDQLMHINRRRKNFYRLPIMKKALHQLREPPHLVLHDHQLMQKLLAIVRLLRRIARAQLVERETDKVERILDLMREAAGQLPERGESLEAIQLMLALARMPELPDHVVEASSQQTDFVAPMRLRNRLQ